MINVLNKLLEEKNVGFYYNDNALVLFFGDIENQEPFLTTWRLFIDCAWRICVGNKIVVGNLNECDEIFNNLNILQGLKIKEIDYFKSSKDFKIVFDSGVNFRVFVTSRDYAQWQLGKSDGYRLKLDINSEIVEYWDESDVKI